jgi:hypothetical protein
VKAVAISHEGEHPGGEKSPGELRAHVGLNSRPEVADSCAEQSLEVEGRSGGLSIMGDGCGAALRCSRRGYLSGGSGSVFERHEGTGTGDGDQAAQEEESFVGRTP